MKTSEEIIKASLAAVTAINILIEERPMLSSKMCGTTTLGNIRSELKSAIRKHEQELKIITCMIEPLISSYNKEEESE